MKNARLRLAKSSAPATGSSDCTDRLTPRQHRALLALLRGPVMREALDRIAGASNSPNIIMELRRMGLPIECDRVEMVDRDGRACRPGCYSLPLSERKAARMLLGGGYGKRTR